MVYRQNSKSRHQNSRSPSKGEIIHQSSSGAVFCNSNSTEEIKNGSTSQQSSRTSAGKYQQSHRNVSRFDATMKDSFDKSCKEKGTHKNVKDKNLTSSNSLNWPKTHKVEKTSPDFPSNQMRSPRTTSFDAGSASSLQRKQTVGNEAVKDNLNLLEDVVALVEVRDGNEDHSDACAQQLERLGATIVKNLTRKVTHVIFRNGRKGTYEKAKLWNIPLLSALWIEKCKQDGVRASEADFPAIIPSAFTSPYGLGKIKRFKSMQPKAWKEPKGIMTKLEQREKRKKKRDFKKNYKSIINTFLSPSRKHSTDQSSSALSDEVNATSPESFSSPGMTRSRDILDLLEDEDDNIALSQESTWNVPLVKRLFLNSPALKRVREEDDTMNDSDESLNTSGLLNVSLHTMQLLGLDTDSIEDWKSRHKNSLPYNSPRNTVDAKSNEKLKSKTTNAVVSSNSNSNIESIHDKLKPKSLFKDFQLEATCGPELKENLQVNIVGNNSAVGDIVDEVGLPKIFVSDVNSTNSNLKISQNTNVTVRKAPTNGGRRLYQHQSSLLTDIILAKETPETEKRGVKRSRMSDGIRDDSDVVKSFPRQSLDDFDLVGNKKPKLPTKPVNKNVQPKTVASTSQPVAAITTHIGKSNSLVDCNHNKGKELKPVNRKLIVEPEKTASNLKHSGTLPSIVTTSMHSSERETVMSIISSLGGFRVVSCANDSTTHVVCGDSRRTLNVLFAIARCCWLVSKDWIYKSLEAQHWVDEEPYELFDTFPSAQLMRLERSVLGNDYTQKLLLSSGSIYVADNTIPASSKLKELITLVGGKVVPVCRQAQICVGRKTTSTDVQCVAPKWILDCITENSVLPLKNYLLSNS